MVAPLDIHIVELHQLFHNDICSGSPVKDIADDMEIVNGQVLDQVAQRLDKLRAHFAVDDGADDLIVVYLLIFIAVIHMDQLVDDNKRTPAAFSYAPWIWCIWTTPLYRCIPGGKL